MIWFFFYLSCFFFFFFFSLYVWDWGLQTLLKLAFILIHFLSEPSQPEIVGNESYAINQTCVVLTWTQPDEINGVLELYKIKTNSGPDKEITEGFQDKMTYIYPDLDEDTTHEFQVSFQWNIHIAPVFPIRGGKIAMGQCHQWHILVFCLFFWYISSLSSELCFCFCY